jgi:hypothetical protein
MTGRCLLLVPPAHLSFHRRNQDSGKAIKYSRSFPSTPSPSGEREGVCKECQWLVSFSRADEKNNTQGARVCQPSIFFDRVTGWRDAFQAL